MVNYTHKNVKFEWHGGLNVHLPFEFLPLKMQLNNGSPSWRLNRSTWLSKKQLEKIIKNEFTTKL